MPTKILLTLTALVAAIVGVYILASLAAMPSTWSPSFALLFGCLAALIGKTKHAKFEFPLWLISLFLFLVYVYCFFFKQI